MEKVGVVLLSGGLDSTTLAAYAKNRGHQLTGITLHYGQTHSKEVHAAKLVASSLDLIHQVVDISFFRQLAWYSALTNPDVFEIPSKRVAEDMAQNIPVTYVPLRNTFFLTIAAAFLESEVLSRIERDGVAPNEVEASIFVAANAIDYSGYPDCRPEYFQEMARVLLLGSKLGSQYRTPINVETPLITMTKAEIVKLAMVENAPIEITWSCYQGGEQPCGKCDSCILRAKGFREAMVDDPSLFRIEG
jgi:7-cyano-7-deazaguanine synthase